MGYVGEHRKTRPDGHENLGPGAQHYADLGQSPETPEDTSGRAFYSQVASYFDQVATHHPNASQALATLSRNAQQLADSTGEHVYKQAPNHPGSEDTVRQAIGRAADTIADLAVGRLTTADKVLLFETWTPTSSQILAITRGISDILGAPDYGQPGTSQLDGVEAQMFTKATDVPGVGLVSEVVFANNEKGIKSHEQWSLVRLSQN